MLFQRKICPKKGRRLRSIEVPTDSVPEFDLVDYSSRYTVKEGGEEARKRDEKAQKQREEATREETTHSAVEEVSGKHARIDKSDTEMDMCTEGEGEAGTSQSHSTHKKGHMTNIYLTDLDEEAIEGPEGVVQQD